MKGPYRGCGAEKRAQGKPHCPSQSNYDCHLFKEQVFDLLL